MDVAEIGHCLRDRVPDFTRNAVCDVVGDDGGNDDTGCEPDDHHFRNN